MTEKLLKKLIFEDVNFKQKLIENIANFLVDLNEFIKNSFNLKLIVKFSSEWDFINSENFDLAKDIFFSLEPHKIVLKTIDEEIGEITANKNYEPIKEMSNFIIKNNEKLIPSISFIKLDEEGINYNLIVTMYKLHDFNSYVRFAIKSKKHINIDMTKYDKENVFNSLLSFFEN